MRPLAPTRIALALCLSLGAGGCQSDQTGPEPSVERVGRFVVLRVVGTPYEMGHQHGTLLRDEILDSLSVLDSGDFRLLERAAELMGLDVEARERSLPEIVEECQGLVDGVGDATLSLDRCLLLAYGDIVFERIRAEWPGCTQFVTAAPVGTGVLHGRNLDWAEVAPLVRYPVIVVRRPTGRIPSATLGFPANVSPFSAMNEAGLAVASNEAYSTNVPGDEGRSNIQLLYRILGECETVDEAVELLRTEGHASAEILALSDATGDAAMVEIAARGVAVRRMDAGGVLYTANHFVHPDMVDLNQELSADHHSLSRWARLGELLDEDGASSLRGSMDLEAAVAILRDTYNPLTGVEHPPSLVDDGGTIANNGALNSLVFQPDAGLLYIAEGEMPIPQNPYRGFSMEWLVHQRGPSEPDPTRVE